MTKKGWMAAGLTIGLIAGSCVSAFAAEGLKYVQASINDTFKFQVNGEAKSLDDEYTVLLYKDRTYLPVRGIGELMGADIDWDDTTKTIIIDTSNINKPNEPSTPPEENGSDNSIDVYDFRKLPQYYENEDYRLIVSSLSTNIGVDKMSRVYFRLENLKEQTICVLPSKIVIEANGSKFSKYSTDVDLNNQDKRLYTTVLTEEEQEISSYITLPDSIKDARKVHLEIPIEVQKDGKNQVEIVEFNIDTEAK